MRLSIVKFFVYFLLFAASGLCLSQDLQETSGVEQQDIINISPLPETAKNSSKSASSTAPVINTSPANQASPTIQALNSGPYRQNNNSANLTKAFSGLAVVIAMILGAAWLAKKMTLGRQAFNQNMRVISMLPLSTKEKLLLVDVCGQQLLLGVSPSGINKLADIDASSAGDQENQKTDKQKQIETVVEQMSIKQKIGLLKKAALANKSKNESLDDNQLSASDANDFSRKLKDFMASGKQPGND